LCRSLRKSPILGEIAIRAFESQLRVLAHSIRARQDLSERRILQRAWRAAVSCQRPLTSAGRTQRIPATPRSGNAGLWQRVRRSSHIQSNRSLRAEVECHTPAAPRPSSRGRPPPFVARTRRRALECQPAMAERGAMYMCIGHGRQAQPIAQRTAAAAATRINMHTSVATSWIQIRFSDLSRYLSVQYSVGGCATVAPLYGS
jgi:hypothetical protein